jgi:eukaryotic-like serine/threonine-protein kinase
MVPVPAEAPWRVDRYAIFDEIASGGMATVHIGRLLGPAGFTRTVAIKRLHANLARDPDFVKMLVDEARLASRIRHPNVVATVDVVQQATELLLVLEYVQGESLSRLIRSARRTPAGRIPLPIAASVAHGMLMGLHAAHEATDERGLPLGIVHRDVSPQNVLVGVDGVARVIDFGVAKAASRMQSTREGQLKGKLGYMSPEQLRKFPVDRRADVFAASVVLWELLTAERLFSGDDPAPIVHAILEGAVPAPSTRAADLPPVLDDIVVRGLAREPDARFPSCRELAMALEATLPMANAREVGEWVASTASEALQNRAVRVAEIEATSSVSEVLSKVGTMPISESVSPPSRSGTGPAGFHARSAESHTGRREERAIIEAALRDLKEDLKRQTQSKSGHAAPSRTLSVLTLLILVPLVGAAGVLAGVYVAGRRPPSARDGSELAAPRAADVQPQIPPVDTAPQTTDRDPSFGGEGAPGSASAASASATLPQTHEGASKRSPGPSLNPSPNTSPNMSRDGARRRPAAKGASGDSLFDGRK